MRKQEAFVSSWRLLVGSGSGCLMMYFRVSANVLLTLALACSSTEGSGGGALITADELLWGASLDVAPETAELVAEEEVLALSDEMRSFLDTFVDRRGRDFFKLHQLTYAIINSGTFDLKYDDVTRTASETFHQRRGNCLSFSNMFVAMARDLGMKADFQEVDIPPDWTRRDDTFVLNRHVNIRLDLGPAGEHVVDFNIDDFSTSYDRRTISNARALAHFYNNLGVERMQARDTALAFAYFRKAIVDNDRRFSPAWTNLGTLYLREDRPAHAEAAYLQALKVSSSDYVAMSNLVNLYEARGDLEQADNYRRRVGRHRRFNPYYRYQQAREAFFARDYNTAIGHLKFAIRKRKSDDRFYFLLGLIYLQKGDEAAARSWMARAEELASADSLKRNYAAKMDMLLSGSE